MKEKQQKPFYQKWWFWVIIAVVILAIIGNILPDDSNSSISNTNENINPPASSRTYIIEVTGTDELDFSGSIGGGGNSRTIDGTVPSNYTVEGYPAVAVLQKKGENGELIVTIKKGDKILNTQSTDADYGVVTVSS